MLSSKIQKEYEKSKRHTRGASKEWLHRVDVEDLLETLDINNVSKSTADEYNFSCPFDGHSGGDKKPSGYMNDGSKDKRKATVWKCHGCGRAGNAITFYAEHEGISKQNASIDLRERYAPNFRAPRDGIAAEFEKRLQERNAEDVDDSMPVIEYGTYERLFAVDWYDAAQQAAVPGAPPEVAYLFERGFKADTLEAWDIGYDHFTDRLVIPVHNEDGAIVGVKGRTYKSKRKERIKYLIIGDKEGKRKRYGFTHYEKSRVVFGLHRITGDEEYVVLCEGELDVIALWQLGIPAISTGSAHLSNEQAILIRDHCDNVIVFFDSNTAGIQATVGYFDKDEEFHPGVLQILSPFINVKVVEAHEDDAAGLMQTNDLKTLRKLISEAVPGHRILSGEVMV